MKDILAEAFLNGVEKAAIDYGYEKWTPEVRDACLAVWNRTDPGEIRKNTIIDIVTKYQQAVRRERARASA
jgi:hypothetical protein